MTTSIKGYVAGLSHDDRHAIIASYEQFEQDGVTGDTPIRTFAQAFVETLGTGVPRSYIVVWMDQLAKECYRYYYHAVYSKE